MTRSRPAFLTRRNHVIRRLVMLPALRRFGRSATVAFLGARTLYFDDAVRRALDTGISQVVVVGAGYDSRAHRLARPAVRFVEIDHPATQRDKRRRAPQAPALRYVPLDVCGDEIDGALRGAVAPIGPPIWVVEGLTMYLSEGATRRLLDAMGRATSPGGVLAVNFTSRGGGSMAPLSKLGAALVRALWRFRGESTTRWATPERARAVLDESGWDLLELLTGPQVAARHLAGHVPGVEGISPHTFCVTAAKRVVT